MTRARTFRTAGVAVPVADEQPYQANAQSGYVQAGVVIVHPPNQSVIAQHQALDTRLRRQMSPSLRSRDVAAAVDGISGLGQRQGAGQLPQAVEGEHDRELAGPCRDASEKR